MTSGVYAITNTITGGQYIGASHDIEKRWKNHRMMLRLKKSQHTKLQKAWLEFGEDAFRFEVLEEVEVSRLAERETYYLREAHERMGGIGYSAPNLGGSGLWLNAPKAALPGQRMRRMNVYVEPDAREMLTALSKHLYPNRNHKEGLIVEQAIRAMHRKVFEQQEG